jgi:hypothetical protein
VLASGAFSFLRCGAPAFDDARRPGCLVNETPLAQIKEDKMDKQFIGICAPVVLLLLALAKNATNSATSEDDTIAKHKKLLGIIFGIMLILNFLFVGEWALFLLLTLVILFIGKLLFHFIY